MLVLADVTWSRRTAWVAILVVCTVAGAVRAESGLPRRSRVAVARAERILAPEGLLNPSWLYPEGKIEYSIVEGLLGQAVTGAVGVEPADEAWDELLGPNDRVGIQLDVKRPQTTNELLEALILRIHGTGVPLRNIIIYAGDEAALFRAGFDLSNRTPGVRVMASDDQGYRGGLTRIVLDHCTKIINVSRLRADRRIGMHAALANCLASVPYVERERLMREPQDLASAAANATLRRTIVLHIVDALQPVHRPPAEGVDPGTWLYRGILASSDPVALDTVCRSILLEGPGGDESPADGDEAPVGGDEEPPTDDGPDGKALTPPVQYLEPATERFRLGNSDPERIDVERIGP